MVVARFNLDKTWRELLIAICIPTILFLISFVTLCVIMQSVKVGDDTKMRCQYCTINSDSNSESSNSNSKYEMSSPSTDNKDFRKDETPLVHS